MQERSGFEREIMDLEIDYEVTIQVIFPLPKYHVDGRKPVISSGFKQRGRPDHLGVDIMYPYDPSKDGPRKTLIDANRMEDNSSMHWTHENTWVVACMPGKVIDVVCDINNGCMVLVLSSDGHQYKYLHLSDPIVKIYDTVEAGQPLAQLYKYKNPKPIHLHLEVRKRKGEEKNPVGFLKNPTYLSSIDITNKLKGKNLYPYLTDFSKTISDNKKYSQSEKWISRINDIYQLLNLPQNSTGSDFARAVAKWQRENKFTLQDVNGILGPKTWEKMRKKLSPVSNELFLQANTSHPITSKFDQLQREYDSQPGASNSGIQPTLKEIYNPIIMQWVQNSLNRILNPYPNLETDGKWGSLSSDAIKILQKEEKLTPTGYLDEKTISAIEDRNLQAYTNFRNDKRFIVWAQMALNLIYFRVQGKDYHPGGIGSNGTLGPQTKEAVMAFQNSYFYFGLSPTGNLDEDTINELLIASSGRPLKMDGSQLDLSVKVYQGIDWIDKVYKGNDIPVSFIKGWIETESGGQITTWTSKYDERGYMQVYPEEARILGIDHLRLSWDWNYSFMKGLEYIRNYMKIIDKLGFDKNSNLYWCLVKLCHWTSGGVQRIVKHMAKQNFIPKDHTWGEFKIYISDHYPEFRKVAGSDPNIGFLNVDRTINKARTYGYNL